MLRLAKQASSSLRPRTMLLQKRLFTSVIDDNFLSTIDEHKNGRIIFLQKLNRQYDDSIYKENIPQNIDIIRKTMYCNRYTLQLQKLLMKEYTLDHPTEEVKKQAADINTRVWDLIRQIEEKHDAKE
jgi:hypothetical protein